jgi:hypothetical protein
VLISIVITLNCITLALETNEDNALNEFLAILEVLFFIVYILEMFVKITAQGFLFQRGAYLRDLWNIIDFGIILASLASFSGNRNNQGNSINFSSLRVLRILKPLKTMKSIKKLRTIVKALLGSLPFLADIMIIVLFTCTVFAIIGLQLYQGDLQNFCVDLKTGRPLRRRLEENGCGGTVDCPKGYTCAMSGYNPYSGIYNFDNFFSSYFNVFIILTQEGWSVINNYLIMSSSGTSVIFCCMIILLESFFLVNLALAIITAKFSEASEIEVESDVRNLSSSLISIRG